MAARAFAALAENVRDCAVFVMAPEGAITVWGEGARLSSRRGHGATRRGPARAWPLLELITEALDFSRIEARREVVGWTAFPVGDRVAAAVERIALPARGLELADAVSGYASGLAAWGDQGSRRQSGVERRTISSHRPRIRITVRRTADWSYSASFSPSPNGSPRRATTRRSPARHRPTPAPASGRDAASGPPAATVCPGV